MESFLINWPEEEKWFIAHSRLEGEGKVMVFEFLKEGESKETWTELASMTAHVGAKPENPQAIWQNLMAEAKNNFPNASVNLLKESLEGNFPYGTYCIEGIDQATICHLIKGNEGIYMNVVVFKEKEISEERKQKWTELFHNGQVMPQGIQETLKRSGLAHLHLPEKRKRRI